MSKSKVITTLRDRPQIEAALDALARVRTEPESQAPLRTLAGYGAAVLPVVTSRLDTPDPWMVRALGRTLAQLQDRSRAADSLRRAILDPHSSDRRRIVSMVLLDQFLEQPLDEGLFKALGSPTEVATHALLEEIPAEERLVRLDYLSIIHVQQPQEILFALDRFREVGSDAALAALQFFALDERDVIAEAALEGLGAIRRPAALQALLALEANLFTSRRPLAQRMQRKLRLSGVPDQPLPNPPAGSRLLISPLDGAGNRLLLFLFPHGDGYRGVHIFLDDDQGVRGAYEVIYSAAEVPGSAPAGTVHPAPHPWEGIFLLEGTWGYALQLLRRFLTCNEARDVFCPLEYRFFCEQVWCWAVPAEEPPALPAQQERLPEQAAASLLATPFLASWFLESESIYRAALGLLSADFSRPQDQLRLAQVAAALTSSESTSEVCFLYASRLRDMAEWLLHAGEDTWAAIALASATELEGLDAEQSPFAQALLQKGLLVTVGNLRHGVKPE